MGDEVTISKENLLKALAMLDEMEDKSENPDYDVLSDAKKLNLLIPGLVYGKASDRIRYLCKDMLKKKYSTIV